MNYSPRTDSSFLRVLGVLVGVLAACVVLTILGVSSTTMVAMMLTPLVVNFAMYAGFAYLLFATPLGARTFGFVRSLHERYGLVAIGLAPADQPRAGGGLAQIVAGGVSLVYPVLLGQVRLFCWVGRMARRHSDWLLGTLGAVGVLSVFDKAAQMGLGVSAEVAAVLALVLTALTAGVLLWHAVRPYPVLPALVEAAGEHRVPAYRTVAVPALRTVVAASAVLAFSNPFSDAPLAAIESTGSLIVLLVCAAVAVAALPLLAFGRTGDTPQDSEDDGQLPAPRISDGVTGPDAPVVGGWAPSAGPTQVPPHSA